MNIRPIAVCAMVALFYMLMGLAMAGQAGETTYFPIEMRPPADSMTTVVVEPGDHFWKISAVHLANMLDREVANREISPYWRDMVDANLDRLRSGDPDLIFPGEQVVLPAIEQP